MKLDSRNEFNEAVTATSKEGIGEVAIYSFI